MRLTMSSELPLVFTAGLSQKVIFCTAHWSNAFSEFLSEHLDVKDHVLEQDHNLHGPRSTTDEMNITGEQKLNEEELKRLAFDKLNQVVRDGPVIGFGFDNLQSEV